MNELKSRIKQKIDTIENWEEKNPILLNGEIGFVSNGNLTGQFKIGNGISKWNELNYSFNEINLVNIKIVSSDNKLDLSFLNKTILVTNTCNITIESISNGFNCVIKNISSNSITIIPSNTTIDDSSSNIVLNKNEFISIIQYNNKFYIINTNKINTTSLGNLSANNSVVIL